MSGPWDNYAPAAAAPAAAVTAGAAGPWQKYQAPSDATQWDPPGELAPIQFSAKGQPFQMRWAVPRVVDQIVGAFTLPGDVLSGKTPLDPRVPYSQQDPNTLDRAATLASIVSGGPSMAERGMVAAPARAITTAAGGRLAPLVSNEIQAAGMDAGTAMQRLQSLGPDAVIGDLTPRLQARTAAVATVPGPGQDMVTNFMRNRAAGASARLNQGLADAVGGVPPSPAATTAAIDARKEALQPYYQQAASKGLPIDPKPILAQLNGQIATTVPGPTMRALQTVKNMFNVDPIIASATGTSFATDPATYLAIRHEIDGMIGSETNTTVIRALSQIRNKVDMALQGAVPNIKNIDAFYQEQARQQEGYNLGRNALANGNNAIHPDDLAAEMQKTAMQSSIGPMGYPSQYPDAIRQGLASQMYQIVGTNANDRVALKQIIMGDGKWNYQKIASTFGEDKARQLLDLFSSEATKANTEALATAGARTDVLRSAKAGIEPSGAPEAAGFVRSLLNLKAGDAALAGLNKVTGGSVAAYRASRNADIARSLLMRAPDLGPPIPSAPSALRLLPAQIANGAKLQMLLDQARRGGVLGNGGGGY